MSELNKSFHDRTFLSCLCFAFCLKTKTDPKSCFIPRNTGLFKRRGSAENAVINNVTQRKPRHAKLSVSPFSHGSMNIQ